MHKIGNYMQAITSVLTGALLLVLTISVFLQILSREILHLSWTWTDESARFSFIWCALLSASILVRKNRHFSVTIIKEWIKSPKVRMALDVLGAICVLAVSICLFVYGLQFAKMGLKKMAPTTQMRMIWVYASIPTGSFCMVFYALENLLTGLHILAPMTTDEMDQVTLSSLLRRKGRGV